QEPQLSAVLKRCLALPVALYVRLLLEQAIRWRSDAKIPAIGADISSLLRYLFGGLSRPENHGERLVSKTLGLLAAAKHGLSEDELLDNLSADSEVLAEFRSRSVHSYPAAAIPPIVWSRLRGDLEPYLASRGADGASLLTFFHR